MQHIDRDLIERFRNGDVAAFDQLYERMHLRIYRFGLRLTACREDAEDITVQTFAEAHRARGTFLGRSSLETWFYRIALHQAHRIRRKKREESRLHDTLVDTDGHGGFQRIELEQLIEALPERARTSFVLVRCEGLSYREAALVMGKPMGTVQSDVHKASRMLRSGFVGDDPVKDTTEDYGYEV